jgi:hypothetical protein
MALYDVGLPVTKTKSKIAHELVELYAFKVDAFGAPTRDRPQTRCTYAMSTTRAHLAELAVSRDRGCLREGMHMANSRGECILVEVCRFERAACTASGNDYATCVIDACSSRGVSHI